MVTNRQFKKFVEAGGYQDTKYWTQPFTDEGREISLDDAMATFREELTGQPGPAGWRLGKFPEGAEDLPVTGVSWYEAAAYGSFVEKSLPTAYEWFAAAGAEGGNSDILRLSNFNGREAGRDRHRGMDHTEPTTWPRRSGSPAPRQPAVTASARVDDGRTRTAATRRSPRGRGNN